MNGMTFTGEKYCNVPYDTEKSYASLDHLASTGATWVALTVTWYQKLTTSSEIFPIYGQVPSHTNYYLYESATPQSIVSIINYAKNKHGLKVMLKPHIDV